MIDYKGARQCESGRKRKLKDFLQTVLLAAIASALFAAVIYELGKPGGALDVSLGITSSDWKK